MPLLPSQGTVSTSRSSPAMQEYELPTGLPATHLHLQQPSVVNPILLLLGSKPLNSPGGKSVSLACKDHHGHNRYFYCTATASSEGYTSAHRRRRDVGVQVPRTCPHFRRWWGGCALNGR